MTAALEFDAAVVGAGQAAPSLAVTLAQQGRRVALFEALQVGGSCINYGCTPTKTLRKSARVAHLVRTAADYGVHAGACSVDFSAAMRRMHDRVDTARAGLEAWIGSQPNISLLRAWGSFTGRHDDGRFAMRAGDTALLARQVFLNTGTRAFIPPIPGLAQTPHLDNVSLLALTERPEHLVILGGSYIGLEMGQIFARLGSRVTVIEAAPRITPREDPEVCAAIEALLAGDGVAIHAGTPASRVEALPGGGAAVHLGERRIEGSHLLVATGRLPNTERLNLASVGVATDAQGYVPTNGRLETNVPGIWALGDVNRRGAFTHTSYHDHEIVRDNLAGASRSADDRVLAYAMYTDPPLGRVGISEAEARRSGRRILMATHAMKDVSRAKEEGETAGLIKLLVDADSERFVGATVLGIGGDEVIQVISNFMATGASWKVMRDALPVHPTVTEFLPTILAKLAPL